MKPKKPKYESKFVKAKKEKLGEDGWAKLVGTVKAEEKAKKKPFKKHLPEVDLQKIKDAITLEFASQEYYKDFEIRFEPSKFTDPETLEEKTTSTTLLIVTNKVTDEMNFTLDKVFKIYKNGITDEILQNAIKWLKKQPRIIKGNIRDYNAIDASKEKTSKLFVNTFHSLGKRFNGQGGVMRKK